MSEKGALQDSRIRAVRSIKAAVRLLDTDFVRPEIILVRWNLYPELNRQLEAAHVGRLDRLNVRIATWRTLSQRRNHIYHAWKSGTPLVEVEDYAAK